ncbi:hypothetical protein ABID95_002616 [Streptomyces atratus]
MPGSRGEQGPGRARTRAAVFTTGFRQTEATQERDAELRAAGQRTSAAAFTPRSRRIPPGFSRALIRRGTFAARTIDKAIDFPETHVTSRTIVHSANASSRGALRPRRHGGHAAPPIGVQRMQRRYRDDVREVSISDYPLHPA